MLLDMIDAPITGTDIVGDRNDAPRANITLLCEVRQGSRAWSLARLEDISPQGFRISWMPLCDPSQPLRIRIPGMQLLSAKVCWREGKAAGCAFAEPLHVAVFDHIVRQATLDGTVRH